MQINTPNVIHLRDEASTRQIGATLAAYRPSHAIIYLDGDLGAGKTTLSRGFIQACGHTGQVKSPTYTLMESYELPGITIHHLDLYRLSDPEELEYLGVDELDQPNTIVLVEWPERGIGVLPQPGLTLKISHAEDGRDIRLIPHNNDTSAWISRVLAHFSEREA
jgi:tRNA threonylcarbamoyladenosine biosynthesis protein TsaE